MRTIVVNILVFLAGCVVLEAVFGDWVVDNRLYLTRIPRNVKIDFAVDELYQSNANATYSRDRYGLRGEYSRLDEVDILTVGGSTTDQRFIHDALTWQVHLSKQLSTLLKRDFTVVNAGIDGQTTHGHIANFEYWFTYIPDLRPKYILFYIGLNDKWSPMANGPFDSAVLAEDEPTLQLLEKIRAKSAFYNAWLNLTGLFVESTRPSHLSLNWNSTERLSIEDDYRPSEQDKAHIAAYADRIRRLISLSREIGAQAIIVNQKSMLATQTRNGLSVYLPDDWNREETLKAAQLESVFADVTYATCQESGAICIDLYHDLHHELSEQHFYDLDHNNPLGANLIGEYLALQIAGQIDVQNSGSP